MKYYETGLNIVCFFKSGQGSETKRRDKRPEEEKKHENIPFLG